MFHSTEYTPGVKFDASILAGQISARSVAMYARDFRAYIAFAGDGALDPQVFARWRAYMVGQTAYSPHTINRMLTAVRSVLREAAAQGYIAQELYSEFVFIRGVKVRPLKDRVRENNRTRIEREDMRRLCDAPTEDTLKGLRDRAFLLTLATSGCRISEALGLTADRIFFNQGHYYAQVRGKTDTHWRMAPLSQEAFERIEIWRQARPIKSDYLFTAFGGRGARLLAVPLTAVAAWKIVSAYAREIGLKHVKPHDFRRYVATQLARTSIRQAQLALGHLEVKSTLRYYVLDELQPGVTNDLV